ncbi:hypothetical protein PVAND_013788 [Polypedilum vanderplanki]|uniref:Parathion hydrolase-related protein n=1 Tax=Polypedilum vanderplanki TaxID=319348 RepID=A0A9J6CSM3_POLVA|nr:hypothetical protein PVAND_013788 [Polypedilum vanderplanki]
MKVQTVLGNVKPEELGRTLTHEHFSLNFDKFYYAPPENLSKFFTEGINEKLHMRNAGFIRQYPYGSKYNINFEDEDTHRAVFEDVKLYKQFGGGTIVENTTCGINRNLKLMYNISKETGVNVIAGTGYYLGMTQKSEILGISVENMVESYTREILEGIDVEISPSEKVKIKCGIIGEIGSAYPISEFEKRAIIATAEAQSILKCGVTFHPGRDSPNSAFEVMRIFLEAGGDASKCVMSHLDRTILDDEKLLEFSDLGGYCQYDFFGLECSHFQMNEKIDHLSDAQRITKLKLLKDHGKLNRILMSHDIHTKHRLIEFGGHGFSHIINNIIPKMLTRGFTQEDIDTITIKNPSEWLQF